MKLKCYWMSFGNYFSHHLCVLVLIAAAKSINSKLSIVFFSVLLSSILPHITSIIFSAPWCLHISPFHSSIILQLKDQNLLYNVFAENSVILKRMLLYGSLDAGRYIWSGCDVSFVNSAAFFFAMTVCLSVCLFVCFAVSLSVCPMHLPFSLCACLWLSSSMSIQNPPPNFSSCCLVLCSQLIPPFPLPFLSSCRYAVTDNSSSLAPAAASMAVDMAVTNKSVRTLMEVGLIPHGFQVESLWSGNQVIQFKNA